MNVRHLAVIAGVLAVAFATFQQARSANEPKKSSSADDAAAKEFAVRYAQTYLRMAELTLQKAQELNRRVPETLAGALIEKFTHDLEFAKAQLEDVRQSGNSNAFKLWLWRAELNLRSREQLLTAANRANSLKPGFYPPIDLERIQAAIELARLRVERGKSLVDKPPEARLAWQLEMMNEGLNRVDEMVSLSLQNRRIEIF